MSKTQFVLLALLFIGTQAAAQFAVQYVVPDQLPMQWEYRTYYLDARDGGQFFGSDLKDVGAEGWELVSMVPAGGSQQICVFKRPQFGPLHESKDEKESEDN